MKLLLYLTLLLVSFAGCTTKVVSNAPTKTGLETGQGVYIALAADGRFAGRTYSGTGAQVTLFVTSTLRPYASSTRMDDQALPYVNHPMDAPLQRASASGAKYLYVPVITHWEPRVAAVSGRPTRVGIELIVYDVSTGQNIASNSISVTGRRATFVSQHADELAGHIIKELVQSFYFY